MQTINICQRLEINEVKNYMLKFEETLLSSQSLVLVKLGSFV